MNSGVKKEYYDKYAPYFRGTNFGTDDFVGIIYEGLQKVVCGWWNCHTLQCIMTELGFIKMEDHGGNQIITQKGKKELWDLHELYEQQNRDLVEALKAACHYLVFHSQGKGATEFFQMNEDAAKGYAVLAKHGVEV